MPAPQPALPSMAAGHHTPVPDDATVHGAVRAHARCAPEAIAIRTADGTVTYAEVAARADAVHRLLARHGIGPGVVVPVIATAGPAFVWAALGVLAAGAAFAAVDPDWPDERIAGLLSDCGAQVVLDAAGQGWARPGTTTLPLPTPIPAAERPTVVPPVATADSSACVFFTSGSTGRPKGAVIAHRAFHRTFHDAGFADLGPDTVFLHTAPPYWDAAALEVFGALMNGGSLVLTPERLLTPNVLRDLIRCQGVNTAWLTSSLFNALVEEDLTAFSGLRQLMIGGERLSEEHVRSFLEAHPGTPLTNGYGPVESMVFAATHPIVRPDLDRRDGIPLGRPLRNTLLLVQDQAGRTVPRGTDGELWIGGDGLALGYLNRPEEDRRRFAHLTLPDGTTARAYRTGDRVRMDDDGLLHYLGRLDRQFKRRGHRIEPAEVEQAVRDCPGVAAAAVLPLKDERGTVSEAVCFYTVTPEAPATRDGLLRHLVAALPAPLRPDRVEQLPALPLGPTGKVDLQRLAALLTIRTAEVSTAANTGPNTGPSTPALAAARELLGLPELSAEQDLFLAGANSLQVLRLAARFSKLLGARIEPRDVYRTPFVGALEQLALTRADTERTVPTATASPTGSEPIELTAGQRRFWLAEKLAPGAPGHVAITRARLHGTVDLGRLERVLGEVVTDHPALRTVFPRAGARPRPQLLSGAPGPKINWRDAAGHDAGQLERELVSELAAQVHDVEQGPLLVAGGLRLSEQEHLLLLAVHHIAYDADSEAVLLGDLLDRYAGTQPPPAGPPPADLPPTQDEHSRLRAFWQRTLAEAPTLSIPGCRPVPARTLWSSPPAVSAVDLSAVDVEGLRRTAATVRSPLLGLFLTAWWRTLARHTGAADHVIGTAVADRSEQFDRTIGYLANNLPIRITAPARLPSDELISTVRDGLLDAIAHGSLSTDELATLVPRPQAGRMPLYQTMVLFQRPAPARAAGGLRITPLPSPPLGPQCELMLEVWEERTFTATLSAAQGQADPVVLAALGADFAAELRRLVAELSRNGVRQ
ncbi:amino acid adenylation domain-containing protein [Kitasatospora aureofaciens]|uniref:amino acid adenylation domain-containing protein n=1 Tax=Kitasatospora aureofaciens TaxID=1894 RepID=UPI00382EEC8B